MKRMSVFILFISLILLIAACSAKNSTESGNKNEANSQSNNIAVEREDSKAPAADMAVVEEAKQITADKMIIRQAQLRVNVKDLEKAQLSIEQKVKKFGGYIVQSNVYRQSDSMLSGHMSVRIPEQHFESFLNDAEEEAADILERIVTGQDVTEQYVDLQSRVKSKRAVEERLLEFMSKAQKTEDLLKISSDLAQVQEEIEVIVGKMKYLENQTSFSTIDISMIESRVIIPGVDGKDLNTWEKTKKQLATSTNFLLAAGSGLIVFLIGNLPVFILLTVVGFAIYFILRRRKKDS